MNSEPAPGRGSLEELFLAILLIWDFVILNVALVKDCRLPFR